MEVFDTIGGVFELVFSKLHFNAASRQMPGILQSLSSVSVFVYQRCQAHFSRIRKVSFVRVGSDYIILERTRESKSS